MSLIAGLRVSGEDLAEINTVFAMFDTSKNGRLSKEDLRAGMKGVFGAISDVDDIFASIVHQDADHIEYEQFVTAALNRQKMLQQ